MTNTATRVRTRFAPSPTGFIHLGNIRSALYPWAFARHEQGDFVLRIEDTDLERSSQEAVDVILEGMSWLDLGIDEGPIYQMQRMDRYKQVLADLQDKGFVYPCYMSQEALDALREKQMANKETPRYDGTWRPEPGKTLPAIPEGVKPVLRFKTPQVGSVGWDDKCKGRIEFKNSDLDDLVIARPDGTPTYNFCVCVDDMDMTITHVIRGDDHVNNTPRQIHIFEALGAAIPVFAHLPTVLDENGEKMSKRRGAKAVTQYRDEGFLADAVINYLARLGWSHGDDELFSREQFIEWFDLDHLGASAGRFDDTKLRWVNAQHIKALANDKLAELVRPFVLKAGVSDEQLNADDRLVRIVALFKDRCETLVDLAGWIKLFYVDEIERNAEDEAKHITPDIQAALDAFANTMAGVADWNKDAISAAFKALLKELGMKMPQLAMPVRVLMLGTAHTPSVDAVLELLGKEKILARLQKR